MAEKKDWVLFLFREVFMGRERHGFISVHLAKRESAWSTVKVRPFCNISICAEGNRGTFTEKPSFG